MPTLQQLGNIYSHGPFVSNGTGEIDSTKSYAGLCRQRGP